MCLVPHSSLCRWVRALVCGVCDESYRLGVPGEIWGVSSRTVFGGCRDRGLGHIRCQVDAGEATNRWEGVMLKARGQK